MSGDWPAASGSDAPAVDAHLLGCLLEAGQPQPVESLARAVGISAMEASRRIRDLEALGCRVESHPQQGVRLVRTSLACWPEYIEPHHPDGFGRRLLGYRQTASTQEAARRLLGENGTGRDGWVLAADHQTAGRGRQGRSWLEQPGAALLITAIHERGEASPDRLVLGSCCAAAAAVEQLINRPVQVRWPNDLLIDGAKLAGILVETVGRAALIGIGINVTAAPRIEPTDSQPAQRAICLHEAASDGNRPDRLQLLDRLLAELDAALGRETDRALLEDWRRRSCLLQRRIRVRTDGRTLVGRVIDLDPAHGLLLELEDGGVVTLPASSTSLVAD